MNTTPTGYREGLVTIDVERGIPAVIPAERWNGWAMPLFDPAIFADAENRSVLEEIFPKDDRFEDALVLTWNGDRPSIIDPQYADDVDGGEYVSEVVIDGQTFLSIGSGSFVWSEWEDEA